MRPWFYISTKCQADLLSKASHLDCHIPICWQTILMKYHTLFFSKKRQNLKLSSAANYSWRIMGNLTFFSLSDTQCYNTTNVTQQFGRRVFHPMERSCWPSVMMDQYGDGTNRNEHLFSHIVPRMTKIVCSFGHSGFCS